MTQVAVQVQPMFLDVIDEVIHLHQTIQTLENIISQTAELQRATACLPDNGPGLGNGEQVAFLHSHQEKSKDVAAALLEKSRQELAGLLAGYLAEHRISQGTMLIDDWDGQPFALKEVTLHCDVADRESSDSIAQAVSADSVCLWLGVRKNDPRISIHLLTGATVTVVK